MLRESQDVGALTTTGICPPCAERVDVEIQLFATRRRKAMKIQRVRT
jgi:hypothetical protein